MPPRQVASAIGIGTATPIVSLTSCGPSGAYAATLTLNLELQYLGRTEIEVSRNFSCAA